MEEGAKSPADIARELGLRRNQLYKWQKQIQLKGDTAFPGEGKRGVSKLSEVELLRRRVTQLEEENEILKKAERYFTKNQS
jgi:transposase